MTPTELEQGRKPTTIIDVNMVGTFLLFLLLPYIFFFGLLMLLTGQIDIVLLYNSVVNNNSMVVFKAWVIGFFTIASISAFFLTAYRTEKYIADHIRRTSNPPKPTGRSGTLPTHYFIETGGTVEASEESKSRLRELDDVIGDREK